MVIEMIWREMDANQLNMVYLIKLERSTWLRRPTKRGYWSEGVKWFTPPKCRIVASEDDGDSRSSLPYTAVTSRILLLLPTPITTTLSCAKPTQLRRRIPIVNCIYLLARRMTSALHLDDGFTRHLWTRTDNTSRKIARHCFPFCVYAYKLIPIEAILCVHVCLLITIAYDQWTQFRL